MFKNLIERMRYEKTIQFQLNFSFDQLCEIFDQIDCDFDNVISPYEVFHFLTHLS